MLHTSQLYGPIMREGGREGEREGGREGGRVLSLRLCVACLPTIRAHHEGGREVWHCPYASVLHRTTQSATQQIGMQNPLFELNLKSMYASCDV